MDMPKIEPRTAHERLCAVIRRLARERSTGAAEQIGKLLKQAEEPLDVWTAQAVGEYLFPGEGTLTPGKDPASLREKFKKCLEVAWTYGALQRLVDQGNGPDRNMADAKLAATELLERCGKTTLNKIIKGKRPMSRVVEWARNGVEPTKEAVEQLWKDFVEDGSPI